MSRRGNMVCFNVSGCEGVDEQLKEWLEFKLDMVLDSTDGTALLLGEEGARMTELEALVATEVTLPEWLQQLRNGTSSISSLKEPKSLLQNLQKIVKKKQSSYENDLGKALEKLEMRFSCLSDSPDFALIMADRDLQLPAPLTSDLFPRPKGSCIDVRLVPDSGLEVSATLPDQQMQLELQGRQGIQLIAVTKQMFQEAAHLQYACVSKSPLPLVAWAKILDNEKAEYVTHCAVIMDDSCSKHLVEDLRALQQPVYKDIAARLDVSISTGIPRLPQTSFSLRLNIGQSRNRQHAKVTVLGQPSKTYTHSHLHRDIEETLQASGCALAEASHLELQGIQAEEGLCLKPLPRQEFKKSDVDVSQLLEPLLEDAAEQLFNWPDEGSLPVLCMNVAVQAKELAHDAAQPLPFVADADVEDDGVLPNQQVIAQELLTRVLIMTGIASQFQGKPDWFQLSCQELSKTFSDGLQFVVVMPAFQTLRQQTFDRIVKAKLADATDSGIVIPTIWSSKMLQRPYSKLDMHHLLRLHLLTDSLYKPLWKLLQGSFQAFRSEAINPANAKRLFIMIVDECHYGATLQQAHDTYVNDYNWLDDDQMPQHGPKKDKLASLPTGQAKLLQQRNFLTLLVSATPYSMLTRNSRLPSRLFVAHNLTQTQQLLADENGLKALDVLQQQDPKGQWCMEARSPLAAQAGVVSVSATNVAKLIHHQVVEELHVLDWGACNTQKVPYHRIEDYVASMTKPKADQHGLVHDSQFDLKFDVARGLDSSCLTDYVLLIDYLLSLQYFRIFRWDSINHCVLKASSDECMQRIMDPELVCDYLYGLKAVFDKRLFAIAQHVIHEQISTEWIVEEYQQTAESLQLTTQQTCPGIPKLSLPRLQLLLLIKLKAERARNTYLSSIKEQERNDVFNETDRIVGNLLRVQSEAGKSVHDLSSQSTGTMTVLRVTTAKVGDEIAGILNFFLSCTSDGNNGKWKTNTWQLFDVIGDFGLGESKHLSQKISSWSLHRALSSTHPARQEPEYKAALAAASADGDGSSASLQYLLRLKAGISGSKSASLQYSDLHGLPCILVLCEKGRMGDTFPQTFCCLDLRIRTSDNHTTFVQEIGRLCRYPACDNSVNVQIPVQVSADAAPTHEERLGWLKEALMFTYSGGDQGILCGDWQKHAEVVSTALHPDVHQLVVFLNTLATSTTPIIYCELQKLARHVDAVMALPQSSFLSDENESLVSICQDKLKWVSGKQAAEHFMESWRSDDVLLRRQLPSVRRSITQWQHSIIHQWEATGYRHSAEDASHVREQLPVRVHINNNFVADALDSADLACILLHNCDHSSWAGVQQAIKAPGLHHLTITRYAHKLPYALVKKGTKAMLDQAHKRTQGRLLGEATQQSWAMEIVQNLPVASKLDRYMQRSTKGKLQGSAIHNYRQYFKPTSDSYDCGNLEKHSRRMLLKAEPQSGKTGAYLGFLLQLKQLLEPSCGPIVATLPALEHNAQPHAVYGRPEAALRWEHPFFDDIRTSKFPDYGQVQPSKYAEKVVLQRAMLLAKCLACTPLDSKWRHPYIAFMVNPGGEYVQSKAGLDLLTLIAKDALVLPAEWSPLHSQLAIVDQNEFCKMINWDGRLDAVMADIVDPARQSLSFAAGQIRVMTSANRRVFEFKAAATASYVNAGINAPLIEGHGPTEGYHNIVQDLAWPSPKDEIPLQGLAPVQPQSERPWFQENLLAHTVQYRQMLQPAVKARDLQAFALEPRDIAGQTGWQADNIYESGRPTLWAPAKVWDALAQNQLLIPDAHRPAAVSLSPSAQHLKSPGSPHASWVFVPTYNRYHSKPDKHMLLDWADAMPSQYPYVRLIVVRPLPDEILGYKQLLQTYYALQKRQHGQPKQFTVVMVLPPSINIGAVPGSSKQGRVTHELGIGYARLAIQLTACWMGLQHVWLMDDNVQECYRLQYQQMLHTGRHAPLTRVSFGEIMSIVEAQFQHSLWDDLDSAELERCGLHTHVGSPEVSPRSRDQQGKSQVETPEQFMGRASHYAMMGISKTIQRCYQVGMEGRAAPWKVTHSIYSMFLLNVAETVAKQVFWPAKPYHDDVDFPRLCEERAMVAAKCQWLFLHKALMQSHAVCPGSKGKGPTRSAPVCHVSHPGGQALAVGQLIVVQVPTSLGQPTRLLFGNEQQAADIVLPSAQLTPIPATDGFDQKDPLYVACWDSHCVQPLLSVTAAQLQVKVGGQVTEVGPGQVQAQLAPWPSCGLFDWDAEEADVGASQDYAPPIGLDGSHFWKDLCAESQKAQLKAAILGVQSDPNLAIEHAVCVYHHGQRYLEELGFLDYNAGRACLQRSDSCIFFANDTYGDLAPALTTVTRLLTEKRTKRHVGHVLIMPCWNDHDRQISREDVEHACQSVLNNKWTRHGIYSTAPLAQCIKPARHSSPDSMSTDSDNESDVRPSRGSQQLQQLLLLPHLVIAFSYNKHKKQKRFSSPDSEAILAASRRKISISDTAAGSSQVTGSVLSPSSYPTSPSSKPLSPMGSLASIPEQGSTTGGRSGLDPASTRGRGGLDPASPASKSPRRHWKQWMIKVLNEDQQHLEPWVIARRCQALGLLDADDSEEAAATHIWTAAKSQHFRTITFTDDKGKRPQQAGAPKLIGLTSWYAGEATALLDVCLFVRVSQLVQVDSSSDGLLQALTSLLSTDVSVQVFTKAHSADPTGFAQLSFHSPHEKDAGAAQIQNSSQWIIVTPVLAPLR